MRMTVSERARYARSQREISRRGRLLLSHLALATAVVIGCGRSAPFSGGAGGMGGVAAGSSHVGTAGGGTSGGAGSAGGRNGSGGQTGAGASTGGQGGSGVTCASCTAPNVDVVACPGNVGAGVFCSQPATCCAGDEQWHCQCNTMNCTWNNFCNAGEERRDDRRRRRCRTVRPCGRKLHDFFELLRGPWMLSSAHRVHVLCGHLSGLGP